MATVSSIQPNTKLLVVQVASPWFLLVGPAIGTETSENTVQAVQQSPLESSPPIRVALHHANKLVYIDVPLSYREVAVYMLPTSMMLGSWECLLAVCHGTRCLHRCLHTMRLLWSALLDAVIGDISNGFHH
jgi:hypothetical protein